MGWWRASSCDWSASSTSQLPLGAPENLIRGFPQPTPFLPFHPIRHVSMSVPRHASRMCRRLSALLVTNSVVHRISSHWRFFFFYHTQAGQVAEGAAAEMILHDGKTNTQPLPLPLMSLAKAKLLGHTARKQSRLALSRRSTDNRCAHARPPRSRPRKTLASHVGGKAASSQGVDSLKI